MMGQMWICPVTDHVEPVPARCNNPLFYKCCTMKFQHAQPFCLSLISLIHCLLRDKRSYFIVIGVFAEKHTDTHTHPHTSSSSKASEQTRITVRLYADLSVGSF